MLKHTDVKGLVCPSYQRFKGAVSKRHPGLELHSHHLFWLLLWETLPYSLPPFTPSQHSVSLCYPQLLYPQRHTHTNAFTPTHSNRPGFVCVTWGELPNWEQQYWLGWMGLIVTLTGICPSGRLTWIRGTMNPVSQTSVAVDAALFFSQYSKSRDMITEVYCLMLWVRCKQNRLACNWRQESGIRIIKGCDSVVIYDDKQCQIDY